MTSVGKLQSFPSEHAGLNGKSPNYYVYVLNNPLNLKDPTGKIPLPVISAIISVGVHVGTSLATGSEITFGSELILSLLLILLSSACWCVHRCFGSRRQWLSWWRDRYSVELLY